MYQKFVERVALVSACTLIGALVLYMIFGHAIQPFVGLIVTIAGSILLAAIAAYLIGGIVRIVYRYVRSASWLRILNNVMVLGTTALLTWMFVQPSPNRYLQVGLVIFVAFLVGLFAYLSWDAARLDRNKRFIDRQKAEMLQAFADMRQRHQPRLTWHQRRATWLVAALAGRVVQRQFTGR